MPAGDEQVVAQQAGKLPGRIGMAMPERRVIEPRPDAAAVRHDDQNPPAVGEDAPHFAQKPAQPFRTFHGMNQQHAIHRHVRQGQFAVGHQRRGVAVLGQPPGYALLGRHESGDPFGLLHERTQIRDRIADSRDVHAAQIRPYGADVLPHDALRHAPGGRGIEIAEVDHVIVHAVNINSGGGGGEKPFCAREEFRQAASAARLQTPTAERRPGPRAQAERPWTFLTLPSTATARPARGHGRSDSPSHREFQAVVRGFEPGFHAVPPAQRRNDLVAHAHGARVDIIMAAQDADGARGERAMRTKGDYARMEGVSPWKLARATTSPAIAPRPDAAPPRRLAMPEAFVSLRCIELATLEAAIMSTLEIHQIPTRSDNYVYLMRESSSGNAAVVDPSDAAPVLETLDMFGWNLTHILATHHHDDHIGGVPEIKAATNCTVVGPRADRHRIPLIDVEVGDGDAYMLYEAEAKVWDVPGHTRGHIAYWFSQSRALFCGDTLFALGCGRVFEGTHAQMYASISKFKEVPNDTWVYCAHEYTLANAKFALHVDPDNAALAVYARQIERRREAGVSTVPSLMGVERRTNPFLRADDAAFAKTLGMEGRAAADVFAEVRTRKDTF